MPEKTNTHQAVSSNQIIARNFMNAVECCPDDDCGLIEAIAAAYKPHIDLAIKIGEPPEDTKFLGFSDHSIILWFPEEMYGFESPVAMFERFTNDEFFHRGIGRAVAISLLSRLIIDNQE